MRGMPFRRDNDRLSDNYRSLTTPTIISTSYSQEVTVQLERMAPIKTLEYFRVPPRWLFVKIVDEEGHQGWGEASLEGHTQAVEGCLDAYRERVVGLEAE